MLMRHALMPLQALRRELKDLETATVELHAATDAASDEEARCGFDKARGAWRARRLAEYELTQPGA